MHYTKIKETGELKKLVNDIYRYKGHYNTLNSLKLGLHLPLRASNFTNLLWEYVNLEEKSITIPRSLMKVKNKNRYVVPKIGLVKIEKTDFYLKCIFSDGFIGKIEKDRVKDFGLNSFESIYLFDGKLRDDSIRIIIQTEELYTKLKKKTIKERHLKTFF